MRKVLSQRQKSPFHLALCHPFPLSHTRTHSRKHTHVHSHKLSLKILCKTHAQAYSLCMCLGSLLHTCTRLHTGNTHSAKVYSYCKRNAHIRYAVLPSPSLSLVLFPNLPDTRCFILPHVKLAPKTFCGADYSIHKFAVKHFYTPKFWCVTCCALYWCLHRMRKYEHIDIKSHSAV